MAAVQQLPHPYGPVGWPLLAGAAALFAALAHVVADVPLWVPAAVAVPLAGLTLAAARLRRTMRTGQLVAACWLAAAAWATGTAMFGFGWPAWVVLAVSVGGGLIWATALAPDPGTPGVPAPVQLPPTEHHKAAELRRLLDRLLLPGDRQPTAGFKVTSLKMWPQNHGYDAAVEAPGGHRITFRRIKEVTDDLAAEMKLKPGCTVRVREGAHKAAAIISVTLVNNLAKDVPYPVKDIKPRSLRNPVPIGFYGDDTPAAVDLYQSSGLWVARKGGGKTVFAHNVMAGVMQCTDAVLWVLDVTGGGVASAAMTPYARDEVENPPIDWVAWDVDEALLMAQTALNIATDRKSFYAPLCVAHDTDILPISAQHPAITILVDEGGEVFGMNANRTAQRVAALLLEITRIGRAMCVGVQVTSQRGTASYLPSDLKAQSTCRAVGPVESEAEIAHVLDWDRGLSSSDLGRGEWFLRRSVTEAPGKIKTWGTKPSTMAEVVRATNPLRPALDGRGQMVGGRVYEQRWERMRPWLRRLAGHGTDDDHIPAHARRTASAPVVAEGPDGSAIVAAVTTAADAVRAQIMENVWGVKTAPTQPVPEADDQQWVRESLAGLSALPVLDEPRNTSQEATVDVELGKGEAWVLRQIVDAGTDGARTLDLCERAAAEEVTSRRQSISEWIAVLREAGYVTASSWATWSATDAGRQAVERHAA
jgi:S-DNA-T family DNA segregation ATPase FtsK/SpoIIIE